jgi:hypothetical protein
MPAKAADDARRVVARVVAKADKDAGYVAVYEEVDVRTYLLTDFDDLDRLKPKRKSQAKPRGTPPLTPFSHTHITPHAT